MNFDGFFVWFAWTIISFTSGIVVHWIATRKQRKLLKQYRADLMQLRNLLNRPIR